MDSASEAKSQKNALTFQRVRESALLHLVSMVGSRLGIR